MVAALAVATVLERLHGSAFAEANIYHSLWFILWWALLAAGTLVAFAPRRHRRRLTVVGLHAAFVVILGGALTTYLTARKGLVYLPQGEAVRQYLSENTGRYHRLPFTLQLDSFRIAYDPVSQQPADYISQVRLDGQPHRISMNHILSDRGIRLYQSSYDDDGQGSWLSLNCDPWGIPLTYLGYALLALAWLVYLFRPQGRYLQRTGRRIPLLSVAAYAVVLAITYGVFRAKSATLMPVLRSGWFVSHVSLVSAAYLLFAVTWVLALVSLFAGKELKARLRRWNVGLLPPAVALLTAGIFVGAVWANVSWGRYWGWDPKEVWALITLMLYALPLHGSLLPAFRRPAFLQAYLAVAFLAVLATYFGVNLLLGGMHSYAG
jgi:ABC-type transport system involved in cytochrome c biogenesis permease subunit